MKRLLTAAQFALTLPGRPTARWVRYLCEAGRISKAYQLGSTKVAAWAIPEGAEVIQRPRKKKTK